MINYDDDAGDDKPLFCCALFIIWLAWRLMSMKQSNINLYVSWTLNNISSVSTN